MQLHQAIAIGQGHVMDRDAIGPIAAIELQVGAQLGDVGRQALKGVHLGCTGVAGHQQRVDAHVGADVGAEIPGPQVAAQELHRGPVRRAVVEAGLALLAAGQQPHPQPIDPGDHPALLGEQPQLLLQLIAGPGTAAAQAAGHCAQTAGGAVGRVAPDLAQAVGEQGGHGEEGF